MPRDSVVVLGHLAGTGAVCCCHAGSPLNGAAVVLRLDAKSPMIDDNLDDSAAAVLGLELLNRTERVEGMPPQPMAKRRHRCSPSNGAADAPAVCEPNRSRRDAAVSRRRERRRLEAVCPPCASTPIVARVQRFSLPADAPPATASRKPAYRFPSAATA